MSDLFFVRCNRVPRPLALAIILGSAALCVARPAHADPKDVPYGYRPLTRPAVPSVHDPQATIRNPIDAFLLAKLGERGLTFAPEASRAVLIRRLTFDLHGLPPTPEEIDAFEHDPSPNAYEKLVDRQLASPRYGERWATCWLDLVRYAESDGFKADDSRPNAWRYRDYVIDSLNSDKPYDRFIREQLAGDELYPDDPAARIATGFLRHYPDESNAVNLEQRRYEIITDLADTTGQVFLGLTVGCARCHNHKFDPITQEDYFRLQSFFAALWPVNAPAVDVQAWEEFQRKKADWDAATTELRKEMTKLEEPARQKFVAERRFRFPPEYQALLDIPDAQRTPLQKQIAAMALKQIEVPSSEIVKQMKADVKKHWQDLEKQMADHGLSAPPQAPTALAMTDLGSQAPPTYQYKRGDWRKPGDEIVPGFLSALDDRPATVKPTARTTGRRTALAEWLIRPDNSLTGRVIVNRLWQHHFGRGIVATPSDFGAQGDPPTHPELLDWLASEFGARGWSLKAMHRLMVTSRAYRQSSTLPPDVLAKDPDNHLFSRMNRQRLEGEALRDALLQVAGTLNIQTVGGPSVYPELPSEMKKPANWPVSADPAERNRRSVYVCVKRNLRYPIFNAFDVPESTESCARRFTTTTAPQSLLMLNDKLVLDTSNTFAARVMREAGAEPAAMIDRACRLTIGRLPTESERKELLDFLERQTGVCRELLRKPKPPSVPSAPEGTDPALALATADLCHALFNLNEFLYVD